MGRPSHLLVAGRNEFQRCLQGETMDPPYQFCIYTSKGNWGEAIRLGNLMGSLQESMPTNTSHQCSAGEAEMRDQMWSVSVCDPASNIHPIRLYPHFCFKTCHSKHSSLTMVASTHSAHIDIYPFSSICPNSFTHGL